MHNVVVYLVYIKPVSYTDITTKAKWELRYSATLLIPESHKTYFWKHANFAVFEHHSLLCKKMVVMKTGIQNITQVFMDSGYIEF